MSKVISQPKIGERRKPAYTSLMKELMKLVERDAARFGVSRSFVIATALADGLGYHEQAKYYKLAERRLRRVK